MCQAPALGMAGRRKEHQTYRVGRWGSNEFQLHLWSLSFFIFKVGAMRGSPRVGPAQGLFSFPGTK